MIICNKCSYANSYQKPSMLLYLLLLFFFILLLLLLHLLLMLLLLLLLLQPSKRPPSWDRFLSLNLPNSASENSRLTPNLRPLCSPDPGQGGIDCSLCTVWGRAGGKEEKEEKEVGR
jgi:hypothetical protein